MIDGIIKPMTKKYYSQSQAADFLGVHRNTLSNMRAAGRIEPQIEHAGNLALYSQEYLDEKKSEIAAPANRPGPKKNAKS